MAQHVEFPYRLVKGKFARVVTIFFVLILVAMAGFAYMALLGAVSASDFSGFRGGKFIAVLLLEAAFVLFFPLGWWRNRRSVLRLTDAELSVGSLLGPRTLPVREIRGIRLVDVPGDRCICVEAAAGRDRDLYIYQHIMPSPESFEQVYQALLSITKLKAAAAASQPAR